MAEYSDKFKSTDEDIRKNQYHLEDWLYDNASSVSFNIQLEIAHRYTHCLWDRRAQDSLEKWFKPAYDLIRQIRRLYDNDRITYRDCHVFSQGRNALEELQKDFGYLITKALEEYSFVHIENMIVEYDKNSADKATPAYEQANSGITQKYQKDLKSLEKAQAIVNKHNHEIQLYTSRLLQYLVYKNRNRISAYSYNKANPETPVQNAVFLSGSHVNDDSLYEGDSSDSRGIYINDIDDDTMSISYSMRQVSNVFGTHVGPTYRSNFKISIKDFEGWELAKLKHESFRKAPVAPL